VIAVANGRRRGIMGAPMNLSSFGRIGSIGLVCLALASGSPAAASCSNASLNGVYGLLSGGFDGSGMPEDALLQITADGSGNITAGSATQSDNGSVDSFTFTGTYSITKTCTGALILRDSGGTNHYNIVLDPINKQFRFIQTDSGRVASGTGVAEGAVVCTTTGGKPETFASTLTGTVLVTGTPLPAAAMGRIVRDGSGGASSVTTVDVDGTISILKSKGTYTTNSNCTGTSQFTDSGGTTHYATILVDGGDEILSLGTDAQSVVSGTAQR